jgi:hypothetical protein
VWPQDPTESVNLAQSPTEEESKLIEDMVALRDALEVAPDTVVRAENTANRPIVSIVLSWACCPKLADPANDDDRVSQLWVTIERTEQG